MRDELTKRQLARLKACRAQMRREQYDWIKGMILHQEEQEAVEKILSAYEAGRGRE